MRLALVSIIALAAAFLLDPHPTDAGDDVQITVEPPTPTELDAVSITVAGEWGFCDAGSSHTRSGNMIVIIVEEEADYCVAIPLPFSTTEEIGLLPGGVYNVVACCFLTGSFKVGATFEVSEVSIGGIAELPDVAETPLAAPESSGPNVGLVAGIAAPAVLALSGAAWYARRRWAR